MSTEQPQSLGADVAVVLNPLQVRQVQQFRERYAQWQACKVGAESQVLGKQVEELAFQVAFSVELALEQVETGAEGSPPLRVTN